MPLPIDQAIRQRQQPFSMPLEKPKVFPGPETSYWFWNPNRIGARQAPQWFMERLAEVDTDIDIRWSPVHELWLVWVRQPRLQTKLCQGWMLLFPVRAEDGTYCPLDERVLARIYSASARKWGGGRQYFDAIQREQERDQEQARRRRDDDIKHSAGEYYDYMTIKNVGSGSKFANHFS